mmetsp:Transcript_10065/g.19891  ORF Transcript_10065/g.19891 Transcript_10065/m.19891 type:complete len:391 (-) Transcript_10065:106-1278(-)
MTIEKEPSQGPKQGSEAAIPVRVNDDDDYYDIDPELARNRSKLRVLFHSATCPCDELSDCPAGEPHCCASKRLFAHMITCTAGHKCEIPGCQHSRKVWKHYRKCKPVGRNLADGATMTTTYGCDVCSAVPVSYDVSILCDRFRVTTRLPSRYHTKKNRVWNVNLNMNASLVDINSTEGSAGQESQRRDSQGRDSSDHYDRLPVWRKRNLMHAEQQKLHQEPLPLHEKENATMTMPNAFKNPWVNEQNMRGEKGSGSSSSNRMTIDTSENANAFNESVGQRNDNRNRNQSAYRQHEFSPNSNYPMIMISKANYNVAPTRDKYLPPPVISRRAIASAANHQIDSPDLERCGSDFSSKASSCSSLLPAHPRDAKRRPGSGRKPAARRSTQRVG